MPIFPVQPVRVPRISAPNAALTVSTEPVAVNVRRKLVAAYVSYSAVLVAAASITVTLNSGAGSAFDIRLATIDLIVGQRWAAYIPDVPIPLSLGDTIDVLAPAGGGALTSGVSILYDDELPTQDGEGGYQARGGF